MPLALPHMVAGLIAVLVGYTSSVVLIIQAATAAGADAAQVSSWLWTLGIGMGVSCIGLSLYYRVPVLTAWSTPGAALLITSLGNFSLAEAIGAFIISSLLITLCGISGWFDRLMRHIPAPWRPPCWPESCSGSGWISSRWHRKILCCLAPCYWLSCWVATSGPATPWCWSWLPACCSAP